MQQIKTVLLILIILILGINIQARRFQSRKGLLQYSEHFKQVFSTTNITILDNDNYYFIDCVFHKLLCPAINKRTEYELDNLDNLDNLNTFVETVGHEFMTKVYNKNNFPLTYRNNMVLNINEENILQYAILHYCSDNVIGNTHTTRPIFIELIIYSIILISLLFI